MPDLDYTMPHQIEVESANVSDYFGIWSIHEPVFRALVERCNGIDLRAHAVSNAARERVEQQNERLYSVSPDGIALLSVSGPMMKSVSSLSDGTSTIRLRQQLRAARKDVEVLGAMLVMDTPGGTVKGNRDLADEVARFAAAKPIYSFTEDMTASAGVSVASQATKRFANNATALYGAMGTYSVLMDQSGMAEKLGIKVHVIRSGEFKGMGEPGTEITEEQLAEAHRIVNALNEGYLELIARGLGKHVEAVRPLADGRIHTAADAQVMGLIDGVQTYEETYGQLVAAVKPKTFQKRTPAMEKTPASLAELKATFPNSTAEWRESQLEAGASVPEAAVAYAKHVEAKAADERAAHAKALEEAEAKGRTAASAAGNSLGHRPLAAAGELLESVESGDAVEDFNAAVAKVAGPRADMMRRQRAIRQVASDKPELYQAFLLATNPGKRQARLINEKLEAIGDK